MGAFAIPWVLPKIADPELEYRKYLNFLCVLRDRREFAEHATAKPFEATIDLATTCQLACPYCATGNGTLDRPVTIMRSGMHQQLLREIGDPLFLIWYFSTGEPLLNKWLPQLVGMTKGSEIFSVISTNLSLRLSDSRIDELLTCGLGMISASVDGATAASYRQYRVGGDFDLVIDNLRRLVARRRQLGLELPLIEWRFLLFQHNQHETEDARRLADGLGIDSLEFFYGVAGSDGPVQAADQPLVGPSISGPAIDQGRARRDTPLRRWFAGELPPNPLPPDDVRGKKCDWLYFSSMLYPNGAVGPCCVATDKADDFGDLAGSDSFLDIWNNDRYRRARGIFTGQAQPDLVCARCPLPSAQDYQFRDSVRALLLNAPDWVLTVLASDPGRFFCDADRWLLQSDLEAVNFAATDAPAPDEWIVRSLAAEASEAGPRRKFALEFARLLLAGPPPASATRKWLAATKPPGGPGDAVVVS